MAAPCQEGQSRMTEIKDSVPLGVVLEKRKVEHRWIAHAWRPVAVIPGAPALDPEGAWHSLRAGAGPDGPWEQFHAGTLTCELFRKETEGYKVNLSQEPPRVFVVLRAGADLEVAHQWVPVHVTVCPYEAQDYLDSGEDLVEPVPMPPDLVAFVQAFVDRHHVDQPFYKRKRKPHDPRKVGFGKRPDHG